MPDPVYTDIHCHPELKTFLSANVESERFDCWHNISLSNPNPSTNLNLLALIDRLLLGNILESQSSLRQLNTTSGTIAISGLYALEKAMVNGDLINLLGGHVNLVKVAWILKRLNINKIIDYDLMKRISSPQTSYFVMFKEVRDHLLNSRTINPGYNLMDKIGDYDPNKLNLILTIEGGHNLFNNTAGSGYNGEARSNLKTLKMSGNRYLSLSLAHVERNPLCAHAYGIKLLHHDDFMPVGCGISPLGKEIIDEALKQPKRILIDIKHMSLESRKQFYDILEREYISERIPILISHGGVTGVSWDNKPVVCRKKYREWRKVRYFQPKGLMGTKFNPWSINLYDEEIKKIVESDGLIGLNLDERILGTKQKRRGERVEYFSPEEFSRHDFRLQLLRSIYAWGMIEIPSQQERHVRQIETGLAIQLIEYLRNIIMNPYRMSDFDECTYNCRKLYRVAAITVLISDKGIKHLCNNILHIVKVAGNVGLETCLHWF